MTQSARSQSQDALLAVEGIDLGFRSEGQWVPILDDVGFTLEAGRCLALVGESGSGKSVTALGIMGLLAGNAEIRRGAIRFAGEDLLKVSPARRRRLRGGAMAMIFQEPMTSLNPVFTVGDQLVEAIREHNDLSLVAARRRALEMLRQVRIPAPEQRMAEYPHQLSGGMRQRVMIAMALANGPRLLIADEPTTALDVTIQAQILTLMRNLQRENHAAILLITHDLGVVAEVADDVAVMYAGRIVERAPVERLFADPQHPYTIGLMAAVPVLGRPDEGLVPIPGQVPLPGAVPFGCRFAARCPFSTARCSHETPPLAEIADGHAVACWHAPLESAPHLTLAHETA